MRLNFSMHFFPFGTIIAVIRRKYTSQIDGSICYNLLLPFYCNLAGFMKQRLYTLTQRPSLHLGDGSFKGCFDGLVKNPCIVQCHIEPGMAHEFLECGFTHPIVEQCHRKGVTEPMRR